MKYNYYQRRRGRARGGHASVGGMGGWDEEDWKAFKKLQQEATGRETCLRETLISSRQQQQQRTSEEEDKKDFKMFRFSILAWGL